MAECGYVQILTTNKYFGAKKDPARLEENLDGLLNFLSPDDVGKKIMIAEI